MAKMLVQEVPTYVDDFGIGHTNLRFKIRDGFQSFPGPNFYRDISINRKCSTSRAFEMRYLKATFTNPTAPGQGIDGATIQFPVPSIDLLGSMVSTLLTKGAICIDLVGEYWKAFTSKGLGANDPDPTPFILKTGEFAPKIAGRAKITSDVLGASTLVNVAYESDPDTLSQVIVGCIGDLNNDKACLASSIRCRHGIIYGSSKTAAQAAGGAAGTVGASATDAPLSSLIRKAPIKEKSDLITCLRDLANVRGVACVGYRGEGAKRIEFLLSGPVNTQPQLPGT
jgi:hypothetical protein